MTKSSTDTGSLGVLCKTPPLIVRLKPFTLAMTKSLNKEVERIFIDF